MKAFALTGPDQPAALVDLPDPELPARGIRIRVRTASVNGFDVFQANGYLLARMEHRFPTVIGRDFAGVIDAVADGHADVAVGDEVFGFVRATPPLQLGTYAELLAGDPEIVVARKPAEVSFEAAAAISLTGVAALAAVDAIKAGPGDAVLVVGATGGVGSIAVQLAAARGATVIGTARAGDEAAFVRSLGARDTIDYAAGDVADAIGTRFPNGIDALIDTVSRADAFVRMSALVRDGGRVATPLGLGDADSLAARGVRATSVMAAPTTENLTALVDQVAAGTLVVNIQRTFPLAEALAALAAFSAGTRGKIVIEIR